MTRSNETLERIARRIPIPEPAYERLLRRRDRKRRNQRISAGFVGIAVFVAAVLVVTSVGSLDRTQTPVVPGGAGTGPTETGPALTGPTGIPYTVGFEGLPPEGAAPSEPLRGELVAHDTGIHPWYSVNVYDDGRLIWTRDPAFTGWIEQRLTPEGVELLSSGAVPLGGQFENPGAELLATAWEDRTFRAYVPSSYAACLYGGFEPPYRTLDILPAWAQDLLRPTDRPVNGIGCQEVTTEDARALVDVLSDARFEVGGDTGWVGGVSVFKGSGFGSFHFKGSGIEFVPLLPHGTTYQTGG